MCYVIIMYYGKYGHLAVSTAFFKTPPCGTGADYGSLADQLRPQPVFGIKGHDPVT